MQQNTQIRGLCSKSSDLRFACAILRIIAQSSDPRFAQQNPRMVQIRTLRLTYIHVYHLHELHIIARNNLITCPDNISGKYTFCSDMQHLRLDMPRNVNMQALM